MIRLLDAEDSIFDGLVALEWRRYLCAMWMVCEEFRVLYEDRSSGAERSQLSATLEALRQAVMTGEAAGAGMTESWRFWSAILDERGDQLEAGQWNAWAVLRDLSAEVAGSAQRFEGAGRVYLATRDRWGESGNGPVFENPDAEIEDSSGLAQRLSLLGRLVADISTMPESQLQEDGWDPAAIQRRILRLLGAVTQGASGVPVSIMMFLLSRMVESHDSNALRVVLFALSHVCVWCEGGSDVQ